MSAAATLHEILHNHRTNLRKANLALLDAADEVARAAIHKVIQCLRTGNMQVKMWHCNEFPPCSNWFEYMKSACERGISFINATIKLPTPRPHIDCDVRIDGVQVEKVRVDYLNGNYHFGTIELSGAPTIQEAIQAELGAGFNIVVYQSIHDSVNVIIELIIQ